MSLISRLGGIEHLEEGDAVHRHGGVVLGDHFLLGDVDHLLHHVHLAADGVDEGDDDVQPRRQGVGVFAEPLDGPVIALRHRLDAGDQRDDDEQNQRNRENAKTSHNSSQAGIPPFPAICRQALVRRCRFLVSACRQRRFSRRHLFLYPVLTPARYLVSFGTRPVSLDRQIQP
jgi:hypothetical protein